MAGTVLLSIKLTARLAHVTEAAVRAAIRRGRLKAETLARAERTAVRFVDLWEAARYYGWPPALVSKLEDEMRAGAPEGETVYKMDEGPGQPIGGRQDHPQTEAAGADDDTARTGTAVPEKAPTSAELVRRVAYVEHTTVGPSLTTDPAAARDAWERATKEPANTGHVPAEAPPGFRLIQPRESATLERRDVYDLVVDGEVVGTIPDERFAAYVREKCFRGEVFVDGRGTVKWRPRVPLRTGA